MTGYASCPCRDCFDVAMDGDLCGDCEEAGCDADGQAECCRDDAYEDEDIHTGENDYGTLDND